MGLKALNIFKKSSLIRDTFIYTLTDAFGKALGFIILPFLSYYLTPDDLGLATNFSVLTSITVLLAGSVMVNALPYFFYDQSKEERRSFISNLLILCSVICLFLLATFFVFRNVAINYLKLEFEVILLAIPVTLAQLIQNANLVLFRLEEKPKLFAIYQVTYIVLHIILMVVMVIVLRLGGYGRIYADIVAFMVMAVFHMYRLIKEGYIEIHINFKYIKELLKFGVPLLPHSLSFWLKGGADKIIITNFCGLYQNGLYSMALTMNSIYNLVSNALMNAYVPSLQKRLSCLTQENEKSEKRSIIKQNYLIIVVFSIIAVLAVVGAWIILNYLVEEKYKESFKFVPLLILGQWIYCIYNMSIQYIYKEKKTLILGAITFTGSLIQVLLTWLFVRYWGVMGVAYAAVIGSLLISLGIFVYSNKVFQMPWFSVFSKQGGLKEN